jgi:gliding motility-associated-like protein
MPNAFTPNGDAINAYFAPESIALNGIEFNVYDTWGNLIYSEKGESIKGWNGKINDAEAENGNYYFTLSAKTFYGKTITKKGAFVSIK